jgi:hypothetical protein
MPTADTDSVKLEETVDAPTRTPTPTFTAEDVPDISATADATFIAALV